jgi:hypothetical protein
MPAPLTGYAYYTPRRRNRKFQYENVILKANEHAPYVYKLQIYRMTPKKFHKISWDYPFKDNHPSFAQAAYRDS